MSDIATGLTLDVKRTAYPLRSRP